MKRGPSTEEKVLVSRTFPSHDRDKRVFYTLLKKLPAVSAKSQISQTVLTSTHMLLDKWCVGISQNNVGIWEY